MLAKAGDNVTPPPARFDKVASAAPVRFTVMISVLVVTPSWAVITVVMVFGPTLNGMLCDKLPEATAWPLTIIVAVASLAVGVSFTEVSLNGTVVV